MRTIIGLLLFAALLTAFAGYKKPQSAALPPGLPVVAPDTFSIASYNVENFFDLRLDGNEYPEYRPGRFNWTKATHDVKVQNIAAALAALRPDIAVLLEVENGNAANELRAALREHGVEYPFRALGDRPAKTLTMPAVLSRFPIASTRGYAVAGAGYDSRNILEAAIALGPDTLIIFANHWPSKSAPESFRIAAAQTLAKRLHELPPHCDYLIAGDFNANYNECETVLFAGNEGRGVTSINHILGTALSAPGGPAAYAGEPPPNGHLYDLWLELPLDLRYSRIYRGLHETPDHILLPASLYDSTGISYMDNSFSVFTWEDRLMNNGEPYRWQMKFRGRARFHAGDGYSDHLPLIARFRRGAFVRDTVRETPAEISAAPRPAGTRDIPAGHAARVPRTRLATLDGWNQCDRRIGLARDAAACDRAIRISGDPGDDNCCAGRIQLATPPGAASGVAVRLSIKGKGRLNLRARFPGEKWAYFNGAGFQRARSGRYSDCCFDAWHAVNLAMDPPQSAAAAVEFEVRAGKGAAFAFCIDSARIMPREPGDKR
jgi:hypothetical protein